MWTYLLEPGTQAALFVLVALALGFVVWDLYDEARDPSPRPVAAVRRRAEAPRAATRARTLPDSSLEIWTDAQGETRGRVMRGPSRGRRLEEMDEAECQAQLAYARDHDSGAALALELFIRRRFARHAPVTPAGGLSRAEALSELGLAEGASEAAIHAAYRKLMKTYHPDHGGSHAKAARLNQAKDALVG